MKKIPTVLVRNPDDRRYVLPEVTPGCEWVLEGHAIPTRKYDGTCCMLDDVGRWWARREVKAGKQPPPSFRLEHHDETTGKQQGWIPMSESVFFRWHAEALESEPFALIRRTPGTYELCGPKINGDPEAFGIHRLVPHAHAMRLPGDASYSTPEGLIAFARNVDAYGYEGIVWHHPDGRMAKLKARDVPS